MSDVAQGADWWLASDGKWYPPASRPSAAPPPPPPPVGPTRRGPPPRLSPLLVGWVQGLLSLAAALGAVACALALMAVARFDAWWNASFGSDQSEYDAWVSMDEAWGVTGLLDVLLILVLGVLFMVWMHRAHRVSAWLNPRPRSWASGWTIGGWFVPLGSAVIPRLVLSEIERLGSDARRGTSSKAGGQKLSTMPIGWVWWLTWTAAWLLTLVSTNMFDSAISEFDLEPDEVRAAYYLGAASDGLRVVAGVCGALYVRALSALLTGD